MLAALERADPFLDSGGLTHADLLRRVQRDILGITLQNLGDLIPPRYD